MNKHHQIKPIKGAHITKILEALEHDICDWLSENRNVSLTEKRKEILECLKSLKLSNEFLTELSIHLLIRMDDAKFVIDSGRQFESLITQGYKYHKKQAKTASASRKDKPSCQELIEYKDKFQYKHGSTRGWKTSATQEFKIDIKTLNKIINQKNMD